MFKTGSCMQLHSMKTTYLPADFLSDLPGPAVISVIGREVKTNLMQCYVIVGA